MIEALRCISTIRRTSGKSKVRCYQDRKDVETHPRCHQCYGYEAGRFPINARLSKTATGRSTACRYLHTKRAPAGLLRFYCSFSAGVATGGGDETSSAGVAPLSSDASTQLPAQILVPLTVPTSLQPMACSASLEQSAFLSPLASLSVKHLERGRSR